MEYQAGKLFPLVVVPVRQIRQQQPCEQGTGKSRRQLGINKELHADCSTL